MSTTNPFEQSELLRLALNGLDKQIAELQEKRAQLAALVDQRPASNATVATSKGGKMSEEARAKISAAAKARWDKVKKAKAEAAKAVSAVKKTPAKKTALKVQPASKKAKKAPAKKAKPAPVPPPVEVASE